MAATEKITIMDIARRTGLSKGTVDRVLHNRGEVSKKSYAKVMEAIQELGYEPNVFASLLAKGGKVLVAVLIPESEHGSFWELAASGIAKAAESVTAVGIDIVHFEYDQYDIESFRKASARMLDAHPSGVVMAPMFQGETEVLTEALQEQGIPYCFIDSKPDANGYLSYFGMPLYKSGYLCADQLTGGHDVSAVLIVRIRRDRFRQSDPTVNRRAGFLDYMMENYPDCRIDNVFIQPNDPDDIDSALSAYFRLHPDVRHVVMFNSRIHLLVPYLERHPDPERRVVGFDNLKANMDALRSGTVSVLIGQRPDEQVRLAIETLAEYAIRGKQPQKKDHFMHMDILTPFNVEDY
ncbi:MAG: LacI family DNA-binding transcriptional regulator [Bacteroidales bacterium]|nr:LacI family DNA-binding transcriptional regulator [Bacteroidales bacterium]